MDLRWGLVDDGVLEAEPETSDDGVPGELIVLWPQSG